MIYEIQWTNETLFFIKISLSLSFYSPKGAHRLLLIGEIYGQTYTHIEDFFLSHIFFREPGGCQCLRSLASRDASDRQPVSRSTPDSLHSLNLTAWLSRGLLPVTHLLYPTALTRCHPPVFYSQRDSLSKHTGSLGTNRKSMSYVI